MKIRDFEVLFYRRLKINLHNADKMHYVIEACSSSPYLCTFLFSMLPIFELRAAIPYSIIELEINIFASIFLCTIGGIIVAAIMLKLIGPVIDFCRNNIPFLKTIIDKILNNTRKKHSKKMALVGETFLVLFVAIPLPGSGAFVGSLICYLFDIKFKKSLILIGAGVFLSAIFVAVITKLGIGIWHLASGFF